MISFINFSTCSDSDDTVSVNGCNTMGFPLDTPGTLHNGSNLSHTNTKKGTSTLFFSTFIITLNLSGFGTPFTKVTADLSIIICHALSTSMKLTSLEEIKFL